MSCKLEGDAGSQPVLVAMVAMKAAYGGPGRYRISIQGKVPSSWTGRLGSMRIEAIDDGQESDVTTMAGMVADQSELAGILSALQTLRLPLLSVQRLEGSDLVK